MALNPFDPAVDRLAQRQIKRKANPSTGAMPPGLAKLQAAGRGPYKPGGPFSGGVKRLPNAKRYPKLLPSA